MAVAFSRFHEHATDKALALLRWQRHATKHAAARAQRPANASGASRIVGNVPYGQRGDLEGYSVADGVGSVVGSVVGSGGGGSGGGDVHEDRVVAEFDQGIAGAAITAGGDDGTGLLREEALAARSEVEKLTRRNAEVLEDSRWGRMGTHWLSQRKTWQNILIDRLNEISMQGACSPLCCRTVASAC